MSNCNTFQSVLLRTDYRLVLKSLKYIYSYTESKTSFRLIRVLRRWDIYDMIISTMKITVENTNPISKIPKTKARFFNIVTWNFWLTFSFLMYFIFEIVELGCFVRTYIWKMKNKRTRWEWQPQSRSFSIFHSGNLVKNRFFKILFIQFCTTLLLKKYCMVKKSVNDVHHKSLQNCVKQSLQ